MHETEEHGRGQMRREGPSSVQDKVAGQRVNRMQRPVSIWCEWYPWEVVTKQASCKHRGADDMSRSVVRVIEPARLQLSQEIAIFTRSEGDGASSNAASKAA